MQKKKIIGGPHLLDPTKLKRVRRVYSAMSDPNQNYEKLNICRQELEEYGFLRWATLVAAGF